MEPHRQVRQEDQNVCANGASKVGSFLCRQSSSTRWIPTAEQIRILRDLYYNHGMRSPNAEQIQRISARLRQYGKIEGKNVFYWFQNHKARERQKKRLAADHLAVQASATPDAADGWSSCDEASSKLTSIASSSVNGNSSCCESAVGLAKSQLLQVDRGNKIRESEDFSSREKHVNETGVDWYEFFCLKDPGETSENDGDTETLQLFPPGRVNDLDPGFEPGLELGRESQGPWFADHNAEQGTKDDASLELTLMTFGGNRRDSVADERLAS